MSDSSSARAPLWQAAVYFGILAATYTVISLYVISLWLSAVTYRDVDKDRMGQMTYGRAPAPYVYRQLIPMAVRAVLAVIPEARLKAYEKNLNDQGCVVQRPARALFFCKDNLLVVRLFLLAAVLSLVGFMWALRSLIGALFPPAPMARDMAPVIAVLLLPQVFQNWGRHPYDFEALFFMTLGLVALARARWPGFYVAYVLGTLNKETMVLLVPVFALHFWRTLPKRSFFLHLASQIGIAVGMRLALRAWISTGGSQVENHLHQNLLDMWRDPTIYDFRGIAAFALYGILVFSNLDGKPKLLTRGLVIPALLLPLYFFGGMWRELRVFYEAYPVLFLLAFGSVVSLGRRDGLAAPAGDGDEGRLSWKRASLLGVCVVLSAIFGMATWIGMKTDLGPYVTDPIRISESEVPRSKLPGTRWNAPGNIRLSSKGMIVILDAMRHDRLCEVSTDNDDEYAVSFLKDEVALGSVVIRPRPSKGLNVTLLWVPLRAVEEGFDRVVIIPSKGDDQFSVGHLRFVEEPLRAES